MRMNCQENPTFEDNLQRSMKNIQPKGYQFHKRSTTS